MKNILIATAASLCAAATPAMAMTYFLESSWIERGDTMCKYGNGTVLNVGVRVCPLSIEAP